MLVLQQKKGIRSMLSLLQSATKSKKKEFRICTHDFGWWAEILVERKTFFFSCDCQKMPIFVRWAWHIKIKGPSTALIRKRCGWKLLVSFIYDRSLDLHQFSFFGPQLPRKTFFRIFTKLFEFTSPRGSSSISKNICLLSVRSEVTPTAKWCSVLQFPQNNLLCSNWY